jgi:hypothetical protein
MSIFVLTVSSLIPSWTIAKWKPDEKQKNALEVIIVFGNQGMWSRINNLFLFLNLRSPTGAQDMEQRMFAQGFHGHQTESRGISVM